MADKFTQRAHTIIRVFAQEEAKKLHSLKLETEHILLGLLREGEGMAAKVLLHLKLDISRTRHEIEKLGRHDEDIIQLGEAEMSGRTRNALHYASEEADILGHHYIGTEHLLLGVLRETEGIAAIVLNSQNIAYDLVREQILKLLGNDYTIRSVKRTKSKTPTLDNFSRNLTEYARQGKIDPVIGRDQEIGRVVQILLRRTKNNPVLIGDPGVGKTAIVEGLAQRIVSKDVPDLLLDKEVITLDLAAIVAGTKYRGEFEERLKKIIDEIKRSDKNVLFIDEIHSLVGAGAAEGAIDAASMLKPSLARGELQCIGATTLDEYKKNIERDSALERRFQIVNVKEPTIDEVKGILKGLRERYEAHHHVSYTDAALEAAAKLSHRYIGDRFLPDKAIDVIDEAGSKARLAMVKKPDKLKEYESKMIELKREKKDAVDKNEFERAGEIRDRINELREEIDALQSKWDKHLRTTEIKVDVDDINAIIAVWTGIPLDKLAETEQEKLLEMENVLQKQVIGQKEAIQVITRALRRARTGLNNPKRPIGSFIFLGPTGVGKTYLARVLAEFMFGSSDDLIRIDMSDFIEKFAVSRLVGAPPGYVGYEEGGLLTEKVRRKPYSVILLDEIEKAHPDVFNILLQVLEEGQLSDNLGHVVDFRNTIIIMTSNIGARMINVDKAFGFVAVTDEQDEFDNVKSAVTNELKKSFNPEFLNRLDEVVVFHHLNRGDQKIILTIMVKELQERLRENNITVTISPEAAEYILSKGYNKKYGVRPLRREIQRYIEDPLAVELLKGNFSNGSCIDITLHDEKIVFAKHEKKKTKEKKQSSKKRETKKKIKKTELETSV